MMNFIELIRSSPYLSKKISRANLFYWIAMGPFLIAALLSVSIFKLSGSSQFFPFIILLTLIFSYKWKSPGLIASAALLLLHAIFAPAMGDLFWQVFFHISLFLGLFITAMLSDEIHAFLYAQWKGNDEIEYKLSEKAEEMRNREKENNSTLSHLQGSLDTAQRQLQDIKEYNLSLKNIAVVSEQEKLAIESNNASLEKRLSEFKEKPVEIIRESEDSKLLEDLNKIRVENYQISLLVDSYEKELEKYKKIDAEKSRLLFEKQEEPAPQMDFFESSVEDKEQRKIAKITTERDKYRSEYEKLYYDFQMLNDRYDEMVLDSDLQQPLSGDMEELQEQLEEKNSVLDETRKELFKLEGELFTLTNEKSEQDKSPTQIESTLSEYLSFTDKECLRLENENAQLRTIIEKLNQELSEFQPPEA